MIASTPDPSASLFARYKRIMYSTFVAVFVMACALIYLQYTQRRDYELDILSQRMREHAIALDAMLKSSTDAIGALRTQARTWYATHPDETTASPLLNAVVASSSEGRVNLNTVPAPWTTADAGNLTGNVSALDASLRKEMSMALNLNTTFKATKQNIPDASWIYYTSKRRFINIYPWVSSTDFTYADTLLEKEFYAGVTPEQNPGHSILWTTAYVDEAGQGAMVTASTGIYEGDAFRGAVSLDLALDQLETFVNSWQLQFGTLFIINDHGQLLGHPTLIKPNAKEVLPATLALPPGLPLDAITRAESGKPQQVGKYYVQTLLVSNAPFRLVLVVPAADLLVSALKSGMPTVVLLVGGLALIFLLSSWLTRREAILPAQQLVRYIEDESRGAALSIPRVPAAWRPWFETIRRVFNANSQLASIQQELDVARRMQQSIVPTRFPSRPDLKLFARMIPAKEVGGDFYDYFWLSDTRIGIVIADVSGKGVPAALFMAVSRTLLRATATATATEAAGPGACLTLTNDLLSQENDATMFVTLFYGIIDLTTNELSYANGGHNPPLLMDPAGAVTVLPQTGGMALGVMEGMPYSERSVTLEPGSLLLLYTDGVTEAFNPENEEFSEARLITTLGECVDLPVEDTLERIVLAVTAFANKAPQSDDITCLAVRYDLLPPLLDA